MRKAAALIFLLNFLYIAISAQQVIEISLNNNWQFRKAGDSAWLPATVPGCIHTDLLANNVIPDPFYADNEKDVQWIENEDWEYRTMFTLDKKTVKQKHIEIDFEGLDTYADVYLNDSLILQADNMFREWTADVKKYIYTGENILDIKFNSAVKMGKELMDVYPVQLPGGERVFTRKAQYQYGWDWGPRLVTAGIWKGVSMYAFDAARIKSADVYLSTVSIDSAIVDISAVISDYPKTKTYSLKIKDSRSGKSIKSCKISGRGGGGCRIKINNPEFWWCNGLGDSYLYEYSISLSRGFKHLDSKDIKFGIQDVVLKQNKDSTGENFYFELNKVPVFAKGANMIPLNSFPSSLQKKDYRNLLLEAKAMNMNMIRVWGGGIYEDDYFYDLCDSLGIMVWQDFMFAGGMYPLNDKNSFQISKELSEQYQRISHHPSVALICGNNEIDEGWNNWGWQQQLNYSREDSAYVWEQYDNFFNFSIWKNIVDTRIQQYHPSTPTFGWGHPESLTQGDCHYWGVWWGHEPFEIYNKKVPRFMSEYGFQGMPSYNSFKQFIPSDELNGNISQILNSPAIRNHQKHPTGYETINEYMARDYKVPTDFEDYIYVSQLLQAEGMQTAIEAHRRNMPYCMGTLFWQLNDCWPVTSWSVIDYYGNRKAAYYTVKEKYKDVMLSVIRENDFVKLYIVNDNPYPLDIIWKSGLIKTDNPFFGLGAVALTIPAGTSRLAATYATDKLNDAIDSAHCILYNAIFTGDSLVAEDFYHLLKPKDMQFARAHIEVTFDSTTNDLLLVSDYYAEKVYLYTPETELIAGDNFFSLLPGKEKRLHIKNLNAGTADKIKLKTLNDINLQY